MFAALALVSATGIVIFLALTLLSHLLLRHWHEARCATTTGGSPLPTAEMRVHAEQEGLKRGPLPPSMSCR